MGHIYLSETKYNITIRDEDSADKSLIPSKGEDFPFQSQINVEFGVYSS